MILVRERDWIGCGLMLRFWVWFGLLLLLLLLWDSVLIVLAVWFWLCWLFENWFLRDWFFSYVLFLQVLWLCCGCLCFLRKCYGFFGLLCVFFSLLSRQVVFIGRSLGHQGCKRAWQPVLGWFGYNFFGQFWT